MSFELKDVWFRYFGAARPALAEVSASFPAGKHTFVLGPNVGLSCRMPYAFCGAQITGC